MFYVALLLLQYCDGGSWTGANMTTTYTTYNGQTVPLYFRGSLNLVAVLTDLIKNHGMGQATHVVVSGERDRTPSNHRVLAIAAASIWLVVMS